MKKIFKNKAFTLAEIMIALFISAVIAMLFLKAIRTGTNHYYNNLMSYAALNGLSTAAYDMAQIGCTSTGTMNDMSTTTVSPTITPTLPYCTAPTGVLPQWQHTSSAVTTPAIIPNRGFCDRIAREEFNVTGTINCNIATDSAGPFDDSHLNFVTTNGMRFFNFGAALADQTTATANYYTVYIDIDGKKRSGRLTESADGKKDADVIKFYVSMDGNTVVPDPNSIAANDTEYLTASVKYENSSGKYIYPLTGVTYRRAFCAVNPDFKPVVGSITIDYCNGQVKYTDDYNPRPTTAPNDVSDCDSNSCNFELDEPGLLGLRNIFNVDNSSK